MSQIFGNKSYAQHGDDLMLLNIFKLIGIDKPSYMDLGAHHPTEISNTALLYERGSSGVNVEANPNLMQAFHNERPRDKNINVGVGIQRGRLPFYMFDDTSGLNSFSKAETDEVTKGNPNDRVQKQMTVNVVHVNDILKEYCNGHWPDLLLTDIEGFDHDVLESADFTQSKPKVICTEIRPWKSALTKEMLKLREYFCYCRCQANLIFVDNQYRMKVY